MAKKPNDLQRSLIKHYDRDDGCSAGTHGKSLSAMVRYGWMEEIAGQTRPGFTQLRRWRTTPAGREAGRL